MFTQIRKHPKGTIDYIANPDKLLCDQSQDIYHCLNYLGDVHSVQRVFVHSRHCSPNPRLAEREIELHRLQYYQSKKGAKQAPGELLGLHFVQSYSIGDAPSEPTMSEILQKLTEHPLLKDFATLGAHHWDKPHAHSHFYVSQFSAVGKPHKMGLHYEDIYELMRYSNRLCVEHGLSIIDKSELRKDKEYSDWVDSVIAEGLVVVHPEKKIKRSKSKKHIPPKNHYYSWMQEVREKSEFETSMLTDLQRDQKTFEESYYYTTDGNPHKRWYVSGDPQRRFYVVPLVSEDGYQRSPLELTVRFVLRVAKCESGYIRREDPETWLKFNAKVDTKLQGIYNYMATAREVNVQKPEQIVDRLLDIGKQMNALRREKTKHKASIAKHKQLIAAYETYCRVRSSVEGVQNSEPSVECEYKEAYALLVQNHLLTAEAYTALCRQYNFENQKVIDYDKRIPELNRQYRDLKKLEALTVYATDYVREIYGFSDMAHQRSVARNAKKQDSVNVVNRISSANARTVNSTVSDVRRKEY